MMLQVCSGRRALQLVFTFVMIGCLAAAAHAQQVTLTWATWGPEHVDRQLIEAFEKQHPNIRIEYIVTNHGEHHERLKLLGAAGQLPDIIAVDGMYLVEFVQNGLVRPIDDLIERDNLNINEYFPAALPDVEYRGATYGLPYISAPYYLVYNVNHVEEAGLAHPPVDWDWDTYADYAKKLTVSTDGERPLRWGSRLYTRWQVFWPWVWSAGGRVFDLENKRFTLTEAPAVAAFDWLTEMQRAEIAGPGNFPNQTISINTAYPGELPYASGITWPFEWDVITWPKGPGGQYTVWKGNAMAIGSTTPHVEEAWTFLKFLLAPGSEGERIYVANKRFQPITRDADLWGLWSSGEGIRGGSRMFDVTFLAANELGRPLPQLLQWDAIVVGQIAPALQRIESGDVSPRVAFEEIQHIVDELLKQEP